MPQQQSNIKEYSNTAFRRPRRFNVVIYNDDFTTMEFVVFILMSVFNKTEEDANALMMAVHKSGKAPAGTYSYDIAKSKAEKAIAIARSEGFPLRFTVEPSEID